MPVCQQAAKDQKSSSIESNPGDSFDPDGIVVFFQDLRGAQIVQSKEQEAPRTVHSRANKPPDRKGESAPPTGGTLSTRGALAAGRGGKGGERGGGAVSAHLISS